MYLPAKPVLYLKRFPDISISCFFPPTPRVLFSRNGRAPSSLSAQFRQGPPTPLEIKEGKLYKRTFGLGRLDRPADSPILALVTSCWKAQNTQASGRKERLHTNWAIKVLCLNTIIISAIFVLPGENGGTNQVVYGMQLSLSCSLKGGLVTSPCN